MTSDINEDTVVPDGGWGWVVVASSFCVMFMLDGIFGSYGLLLPVLMESLHSSPSMTSLGGSIIVGSVLFVAILACPLIERFGCRIVSMSGALIACSGMILSSLANNIWIFLVTYGFITGVGLGLMYLPSIVIINIYFEKKRGVAQSIMSAGSGIGMIVMSPVVEKILTVYDWRGALIIMAGLLLQLCVACALYRPPKVMNTQITTQNDSHSLGGKPSNIEIVVDDIEFPKYRNDKQLCKQIPNDCENSATTIPKVNGNVHGCDSSYLPLRQTLKSFKSSTSSLPRDMFIRNTSDKRYISHFSSHHVINNTHKSLTDFHNRPILSQKDIFYCGSVKRLQLHNSDSKMCRNGNAHGYSTVSIHNSNDVTESPSSNKTFNRNLFSNTTFCLVAIGAFLTQMAQFIPNMFLGDYGLTIGVTSRDVSMIFSVFGVLNTIGRLFPGIIVDKTNISATSLCTVGMIGCAVTCFLFPLCKDFPSLMTFGAFFGFFIAFFCPLQPIMVLDSIGIDRLTRGLGVICVLKGPAAIVGPPLAGTAYEKFENTKGIIRSRKSKKDRRCNRQKDKQWIQVLRKGGLYEWTKNYNVTIIFAGCLCLATAFVYLINPILHLIKHRDPTDNVKDVQETKSSLR